MKKQETFTDIEYSFRKKKTKREEFLEIMDEIIPWDEWVGVIEPYYTHVTSDMQRQASGIVGGFIEDLFGKELKPWQESEKTETEP